ncbi:MULTISPECIES: alpha/beta fold hydrolase [Ectothiorhodospira]|uniref:bifunctional alpha/beta hydrolase/OsmC family protein n=1 Tax=Ectothiorhodospira TaxID=1051 RepID=UPI001EE81473|nr:MULTISPECIES: alpha/beta fold hydrolase [Ectothiorhodospira]MCG5494230.1 alpha/beta fold hydrolase [Ectothiorhodospira variabilis]MCG5504824.1 alpha/beta fold hydrolase [Ectothiorhodospira variabilis]MCG5507981.1 alpha/beta fold hydrolase [Ectothiorhodospira variabilis]MCG5524921.1 alpha/beta fold hydrolase [Ectothiorhodospira haloalkaliphila]
MPDHNPRIRFPGSQGNELSARLDMPEGPPRAYALFAHCFSCTKDILAAVRLSSALRAHGIALLRFDFTGLGNSQGDFANTNFSSNLEDLRRAADYLRQEHEAPQLLIGHSLGGAAVLAVAEDVPEVRAVATINAPSDVAHVTHLFGEDTLEVIREQGESEVNLAGQKFRIQRQFLEDLDSHKVLDQVAKLRRPLMIFHSPHDKIVSIDHAAQIYRAAKHPKSFVSLDNVDHMLSRPADSSYVASLLSAWAERFLDPPEREESGDHERGVLVAENGVGPYAQTVEIGPHRINADEPESMGGKDQGPAPYEFLMAGLGACTSMTLRMYAQRKELPLEHVSVRLRHRKVEEESEDSGKPAQRDQFDREITLDGDLTDDQRKRLLQVADRCPVHRTLESEVRIQTRLGDERVE